MKPSPKVLIAAGGVAIAGLAGALAACTADDPVLGRVSSGPDAGSGVTEAGPGGSVATDSGSGGGDGGAFDPRCPAPSGYLGCNATNIPFGTPALRIDACDGPAAEGYVTSWTAGAVAIAGDPGALYCKGALAGRPALVFDKDGFTIPSLPAADVPAATRAFTLFAVLQYTPTSRSESAAAGILFQRVESNYPFKGPQLAANFAWQANAGAPMSLVSSTRFGGSLRFGMDNTGTQDNTIASVTAGSIPKPFLAVLTLSNNELRLRVSGVTQPSAFIDGTFVSFGSGLPIHIGRAGGSANNYFLGSLSELLFYPTDLGSQILALENQLMTKWGITP